MKNNLRWSFSRRYNTVSCRISRNFILCHRVKVFVQANAVRRKNRALQKAFSGGVHIFKIFSIHDYLNPLILAMFSSRQ